MPEVSILPAMMLAPEIEKLRPRAVMERVSSIEKSPMPSRSESATKEMSPPFGANAKETPGAMVILLVASKTTLPSCSSSV